MADSVDALSFNQLEVGREWVSIARIISAEDIENFSTQTGDCTPTENVETQGSQLNSAPGLLGPSVATGLAANAPPVRTIAFLAIREWKFLGDICAGDALHIRNRVETITPRGVGRRGEVCWRVDIVNQREEVVQSGFIVTLVEGQTVARRMAR